MSELLFLLVLLALKADAEIKPNASHCKAEFRQNLMVLTFNDSQPVSSSRPLTETQMKRKLVSTNEKLNDKKFHLFLFEMS